MAEPPGMELGETLLAGIGSTLLDSVGAVAGTAFGLKPVHGYLQGCKDRALQGRLPGRNHVLAKGIRTAHLCAIATVARRQRQLLGALPAGESGQDDATFLAAVERFVAERLRILHDAGIDHDVLTAADIEHSVEHLLRHRGTPTGQALAATARAAAEARALAELEAHAGQRAPASFRLAFTDEGGWHDALALAVGNQLTSNAEFHTIFVVAELVDLRAIARQVEAKVEALPGLVAELALVRNELAGLAPTLRNIDRATERTESGVEEVRARTARMERILDELVAAARAEARHEVERLRLEVSLKDQIIAAKDQAIDSLKTIALANRSPEAGREALAAYAAGDPGPAETLTEKRAEANAARALRVTAEAETLRREAAQDFRNLAALSYGHDSAKSLAAYRRAAELEPEDFWTRIFIARLERTAGDLRRAKEAAEQALAVVANTGAERHRSVALEELGDVLALEGDRPGALRAYRESLGVRDTLAAKDPGNTLWQYDLGISHERIGYILLAEGDRIGAFKAYERKRDIISTLAAKDPGNTLWQRDRSVSLNKIGDVLLLEGDRPGALRAYRESLGVMDTLAAKDPGNTEWQYDLGISHERIGDILLAEGDRVGALRAYERRHDIISTLAAKDQGNTEWQRDRSVSLDKIGDVLLLEGNRPGALRAYRESLGVRDTLAAKDPGNTQWQRDTFVSLSKIGDVLLLEGDRPGALRAFNDGLKIMDTLAAKDSGNTEWQRDRFVSLVTIGDVLLQEGDRPGALRAYRESLGVRDTLAAKDPGNTLWQRDRSVSLNRIGDVLLLKGDRPGALQAYREDLAIADTLATKDPGNTQWQRDRFVSLVKVGDVLLLEGDRPGALQAYRETLAIADTLAAKDPGNTLWQRDRAVILEKTGSVLLLEGDRPGALRAYRESQGVRDTLAAVDPGNTLWQRDLIVSHWKLADLLEKAPDGVAEARQHWRDALKGAKALAEAGKLLPADAYFVPTIERRLKELGE